MKCFYCKADAEKSTTAHMVQLENCIIVIKNVPCMKCSQCGETFITASVMKEIENISEKCKDNLTEVAVINYK